MTHASSHALQQRFVRGKQLLDQGRHDEAATLFRALALDAPKNPSVHALYAMTQLHRNELESARTHINKAIRLSPRDARLRRELGRVEARRGRLDDAKEAYDEALRLDPDDPRPLVLKADVARLEGDYHGAWTLISPLADYEPPPLGLAHLMASLARPVGIQSRARATIRRALQTDGLTRQRRAGLLFHLARLQDEAGDHDDAFATLREANELKGAVWNPVENESAIQRVRAAWTPENIARLPRARVETEAPVFILGMPRSGTSLVEQILASHPEVHGAGELSCISNAATRLNSAVARDDPVLDDLSVLRATAVDRAARRCWKDLRRRCRDALRITDKTPLNFAHLGLISLLFPGAKIIHCRRDPLDTCVSCYFSNFAAGHQFAYDLEHLGRFYRSYVELMSHWRSALSLDLLEIDYESLVADQERESRRLVEHVGLEWSDDCLRFHETERVTYTTSSEQVRRPMYSSSVRRHERYAHHLGPLRDALADLVA